MSGDLVVNDPSSPTMGSADLPAAPETFIPGSTEEKIASHVKKELGEDIRNGFEDAIAKAIAEPNATEQPEQPAQPEANPPANSAARPTPENNPVDQSQRLHAQEREAHERYQATGDPIDKAEYERLKDQVNNLVKQHEVLSRRVDTNAQTGANDSANGNPVANDYNTLFNIHLRGGMCKLFPDDVQRTWDRYAALTNYAPGHIRDENIPKAILDSAQRVFMPEQYQAAMRTDDAKLGGITVPQEFEQEILRVLFDSSAIARFAIQRPTTTASRTFNVKTKRAGARWAQEGSTNVITDGPEYAQITVPVHRLEATPQATIEALADYSINLQAELLEDLSGEFDAEFGKALLTGAGAGAFQPKGLLTYPTNISNTFEWGKLQGVKTGNTTGLPGDTTGSDMLIKLQNMMRPGLQQASAWIMNRQTASHVRTMKDSNNRYIWQPGLQLNQPAILLGNQVLLDDFMPDNASTATVKIPIIYMAPTAYRVVTRSGIQMSVNPYRNNGLVDYWTYMRAGGDVVRFDAVKVIEIKA